MAIAADDFVGTGALSGWTNLNGTASIVSGEYKASVVASGYYRTGYSPTADQAVGFHIGTVVTELDIYARLNLGNFNGYAFAVQPTSARSFKLIAGVATQIEAITGLTLVTGEYFEIRLVGSNIRMYRNGIPLSAGVTDTTESAGGVAGIGTLNTGDTIQSWQAMDLVGFDSALSHAHGRLIRV